MNKPVVLLGAGGHASVLCDLLQRLGNEIIAVVAPTSPNESEVFASVKRLNQDDDVFKYDTDSVVLVNGVGSLPGNSLRIKLYEKFKARGYQFMNVIAPSADVSPYSKMAEGVQIMPGAVVQTGTYLANNVIINTRASVDHDCIIGPHSHVAPGVTLSGGVVLAENVHVGTGASIIQGLTVGQNSVIGAGACVTDNVKQDSIVYPAKVFIREKSK